MQRSLDDFKSYVQQHKDSVNAYTSQKWDSLDSTYMVKKDTLEKEYDHMSDDMKRSYDSTKNVWLAFKADYSKRVNENLKLAQMDSLRSSLTISGVRTDFTDLSAAKIENEYEHFVNTVKNNKDVYTSEQWQVVNVSWKALNGRKREVSNDLPAGDEKKIIKLKFEYTGIKAANRPMAVDSDNS